ncbi:MAG: hypothetical protein AAFU72_14335 [Pseudomonadota bacterium]
MTLGEVSDARLILWDRPWLMAGLVWASVAVCLWGALINPHNDGPGLRAFLVVLAAGLAWIGWAKLPFQRFVFDRAHGQIRRTRWQLWHRREDSMPLDRVVAVRQVRERPSDTNTPMHGLVLDYERPDGSIETEDLSAVRTAGRHDRTLFTLNDWLTRPDT